MRVFTFANCQRFDERDIFHWSECCSWAPSASGAVVLSLSFVNVYHSLARTTNDVHEVVPS